MNCSTSLALAKLRFLPFHVNCRDPGCASVYLMLSRCSDLFTDVKVFLFSASSCVMSVNTDSLMPSHSIPRFSLAALTTLSLADCRTNLISTGLGGCPSLGTGASEISNSPPTSIPSPSPRTLFTQLSIVPFVSKVSLNPTSRTLCLLL